MAALTAAGDRARGGTLYVTLEPCAHHGRSPPCTEAIIDGRRSGGWWLGRRRTPTRWSSGRGIAALLRAAGIEVEVGIEQPTRPANNWRAYLPRNRRTGRPWVVLKLAASLDGRTAAPDGTSQWITGPAARDDVHRLRARSDAILVGAGTVRADDPSAHRTAAAPTIPVLPDLADHQPLRVVLGRAPAEAAVRPALELDGDLGGVLDRLGDQGIVQLLVEGGPTVAHGFHARPGWSTATCCTSPRPSSAATTHVRCSTARVRPPSGTCGVGRFAR